MTFLSSSKTILSESRISTILWSHRLAHAASTIPRRKNHYQVLGVDENVSSREIRAAFLHLAKKCHPDNDPSDPRLHRRFLEIREAFEALRSVEGRKTYDASMRSSGGVDPDLVRFYEEEVRRKKEKGEEEAADREEVVWCFRFGGKSIEWNLASYPSIVGICLAVWIGATGFFYVAL